MLETVREDTVARLALENRLEDLRNRHAERFVELARNAEAELVGPGQADWLDRLETELDNIRSALDWFVSTGQVEAVLRMVAALDRFWPARAHVTEARRWLSLGLLPSTTVPAEVRAAALRTAAQQAAAQSDWDGAVPLLEEAIEIFGRCGSGRDEVAGLAFLSFVALRRDELAQAEVLSRRALALAREIDDPVAMSKALMALGDVNWGKGEHEQGIARYEEAVELRRGLADPLLLSDAVYNLGMAAFQGGDIGRAETAFAEALELARGVGEAPHVAAAQFMLAVLDLSAGESELAEERARESFFLYASLEDDRSCARCVVLLAGAAAAEGLLENAARFLGAADALRGDQSPDGFELPILDVCIPRLEAALDRQRVSQLREEGLRLRGEIVVEEIVSTATKE
jgi:tetratricopeptide (TPR) repeat protein